ncbi:MAG: tetratricopeptide repeat protein, partial [Candidatus Thorarchaeota archaeon]
IMIKKAYTIKKDKNLEEGIKIIEELLEKYPKNNILHNYKAYWLSLLGKNQEALNILYGLIKEEPEKAIHHDTVGEILITLKKYEKAIEEFQKAIELNSNDWFLYQTYIKLGICHKELGNHDFALRNLKKGKELTKKSTSDIETKQKWLKISNLFLTEIEES